MSTVSVFRKFLHTDGKKRALRIHTRAVFKTPTCHGKEGHTNSFRTQAYQTQQVLD
jgi:hypothetical protein